MVGAIYCDQLSKLVGAMINPIEKGHPDIIPTSGRDASEKHLRNYPHGLEVKNTIGNVKSTSRIHPGSPRIDFLSGITWQAHHREVESLMGIVWDFAGEQQSSGERYPLITGVFYSDALTTSDWGTISGITGRNTKVTGMTSSGKMKMGQGWVLLLDDTKYLIRYQDLLGFRIMTTTRK